MATPYDDLRGDLGLPLDETIFSDTELDAIWERVSGAASATEQHYAALGLMTMRLRNSAAKLHAYTVVSNSESQQQIWDHLNTMYQEYKPSLDAALGVAKRQVAISGVRPVKRTTDEPTS